MSSESLRLAAVVNTDIAGSTDYQLRVGDHVANPTLAAHIDMLESIVVAHQGEVVSKRGDGIFALFASVTAAARASQEMQAANKRRTQWNPNYSFRLRIGISVGEVTSMAGQITGRALFEADRLQGKAGPGQILCSAEAVTLTAGRIGDDLTPMGAVQLKGFAEAVQVYDLGWSPEDNPHAALAPVLRREPSTDFVGRHEKMAELDAAWRRAAAGSPSVVFIEGAAGVGKSRLAREIAVSAHNDGAATVYACCFREDDQPYAVFTRCLSQYAERIRGQDQLLGPMPGHLARLAPGLAEQLPGLIMPIHDGPASNERTTLQRALSGWLEAATIDEPMLLLIDDLQWADASSLSVLRYLAQHLVGQRLLILVTTRPEESDDALRAETIQQIRRQEVFTSIELGGLSREDTLALIGAVAGHALQLPEEQAFGSYLWEQTGGNSFFVESVLRHLVAQGALRQVDGRWQATIDLGAITTPTEVREAVRGQLIGISDDGRSLLRAAAVLGPEFHLGLLYELGRGLGIGHTGAIDRVTKAGLLHLLPGTEDIYRFSHEIVRSVLDAEVGRSERAQIHEQAAAVLRRSERSPDAAELGNISYHLSFSLGPEVLAEAAVCAVEAAGMASKNGSFTQAGALYQRALRIFDDPTVPTDPKANAEALLGAANAAHRAGDPAMVGALAQAKLAAEELRDGELMARVALVHNRGMYSVLGAVDPEQVWTLERALVLMDERPSALRAVTLANLGVELTYSGDRLRQQEMLDEAERMAWSIGHQEVLVKVLTLKGNAIWRPDTLEERLDLALQLGESRRGQPISGWNFAAASFGFQALMEDGQYVQAGELLTEMAQMAEQLKEPMVWWFVNLRRALVEASAGRLDVARQAAEAALKFGTEARGIEEAWLYYFGSRWLIDYHRGKLDELEASFAAAAAHPGARPVLRPALAAIYAETGDLDGCRRELALVDERSFRLDDQDQLVTAAVTAIAAAAVGDAERAELAYRTLAPFENQMVDNGSTHFGSVQHYLGVAAAAMNRNDEAIERLKQASFLHHDSGHRPLAARSQIELERVQRLESSNPDVSDDALLVRLQRDCELLGFGGPAAAAARALNAS